MRLLSELCLRAWNQQFHVKIHVQDTHLEVLRKLQPSNVVFCYTTDKHRKILTLDITTWDIVNYRHMYYYVATMPWITFIQIKKQREPIRNTFIRIARYGHKEFCRLVGAYSRGIIFQDVFLKTCSSEWMLRQPPVIELVRLDKFGCQVMSRKAAIWNEFCDALCQDTFEYDADYI